MMEAFSNLDWISSTYVTLIIVGGVIFAIQLVLLFIGADFGGVDVDPSAVSTIDGSAYSFKFFSLQGLTGFLLMFGIVGLLTYSSTNSPFISFIAALVAGSVMNFLICRLMRMLLKLQSSGNLRYAKAVGLTGTVYSSIPAKGEGQIQITLQSRMIFPRAVSEDHKDIASGTRIKVISVGADNVMVVQVAE